MKATEALVTKAFYGVKDGEVYPSEITAGEVILGALADEAIAAGWAKPSQSIQSRALESAPENKREKKQSHKRLNP